MLISNPSNSLFEKMIKEHLELIKIVAKSEHSRLGNSSHIVDSLELVNVGATAIYTLLSSHPTVKYSKTYLSTAIKWAIKNELRRRYNWYSFKYTPSGDGCREIFNELSPNNIREVIYETIFSLETLAEAENPVQIEAMEPTPDERAEFIEISKALKQAMNSLLYKERIVLEMRFYDNKKIKQIAEELNLTTPRITKIIQTGLNKIRKYLLKNELV